VEVGESLISLDLQEKSSEGVMNIQKTLSKEKYAIFYNTKDIYFKKVIDYTYVDSEPPTIKFNRTRAILSKNKGLVDTNGTLSVFG